MKFLESLLSLFLSPLGTLLRYVQSHVDPSASCRIENAKQLLWRRHTRFGHDVRSGLFFAFDGKKTQYFGEMWRGFSLYKFGFDYRGRRLATSYLLGNVTFSKSDIVVDCGANYADLLLFLADKIDPENYISFEPGPEEFRCIELNAPLARNFNIALGGEKGTQKFFVSSSGADSSLITPKFFTREIEVEVTTLDTVKEELGLQRVKLLKLEAEGFEPEILAGAQEFIAICDYVAIDGGYERGAEESETFSQQTNYLMERGFYLVEVNLTWGRALFRQKVEQGD